VLRLTRVFRQFAKASFSREVEFRANFWAQVAQNIIWMFFFVLILRVVYSNTRAIAGWSEGNSYILIATVFFMHGCFAALFEHNLLEVPEKVRKGTLDFDLLKPIDSQFLASFRKFRFDQIGTMSVAVVMICLGASMSGANVTVAQALTYALMTLCAVAMYYSIQLAGMTLSIWFTRVDNLWVLAESVFEVVRFPVDVYGATLRRLLTYWIPLALLATEPARVLLGQRTPLFAFYSVAWALVALGLSRLFWRFALRHYSSASS
jgi:ABC-2 type transport system permease protein